MVHLFKYLKRIKFMLKFWKFLPFLKDFFVSKEVPLHKKALGVTLILTYAFIPFDLIPDFLSFIGIIDDVVIAGIVLESMIKTAPQSLKEKYNDLWEFVITEYQRRNKFMRNFYSKRALEDYKPYPSADGLGCIFLKR